MNQHFFVKVPGFTAEESLKGTEFIADDRVSQYIGSKKVISITPMQGGCDYVVGSDRCINHELMRDYQCCDTFGQNCHTVSKNAGTC
jgi:hypothetical protein